MCPKQNIDYTDADHANALRKLRILSRMDEKTYARSLGLADDVISVLEDMQSKVPSHIVIKAAAHAGISALDMLSGRLDKMMNQASIDFNLVVPSDIPNSEIFDLLNFYRLITKKNDRINVLSIMRMLACDKPDSALPFRIEKGAT